MSRSGPEAFQVAYIHRPRVWPGGEERLVRSLGPRRCNEERKRE